MVINVQTKENMKKTYIIPEMEIVKVHSPQILSGSTPQLGGEYNGGDVLGREFGDEFDFDE